MRIRALSFAVLLFALACGPAPKPDYKWTRSADGSEEFAKAREACLAQANKATATTTSDALAAKAMISGFLDCMKVKGWSMTGAAK